jgi:hypothetical protein
MGRAGREEWLRRGRSEWGKSTELARSLSLTLSESLIALSKEFSLSPNRSPYSLTLSLSLSFTRALHLSSLCPVFIFFSFFDSHCLSLSLSLSLSTFPYFCLCLCPVPSSSHISVSMSSVWPFTGWSARARAWPIRISSLAPSARLCPPAVSRFCP